MKTRRLIVIVLVLAGLVGIIRFQHSKLRYLLIPPGDLYEPIILEPVDISTSGRKYLFEYKHKYNHKHMIGLTFANPPDVGQNYEINNLDLEILVTVENKTLIKKRIREPQLLFWGFGKNNSGFTFTRYSVPDDLPMDKIINIQLRIISGSSETEIKYGAVYFMVTKRSDE